MGGSKGEVDSIGSVVTSVARDLQMYGGGGSQPCGVWAQRRHRFGVWLPVQVMGRSSLLRTATSLCKGLGHLELVRTLLPPCFLLLLEHHLEEVSASLRLRRHHPRHIEGALPT